MARYRIEFRPAAARSLRKLPRDVRRRLGRAVDSLVDDPRPPGVRQLKGVEELYRLRVGGYRIIYAVRDEALLVLVVRVAHRREAYRRH